MFTSGKRGQAAMEFLMTYGWAILVVLVVIGALAYFGVLSPENLLPEKCTLPIQLNCKDHQVKGDYDTATDDQVQFTIQNGAGYDMDIQKINITSDALDTSVGVGLTGGCNISNAVLPAAAGLIGEGVQNASTLRNGASATYRMDHCKLKDTGRSKNRYKIIITYARLDNKAVTHTAEGELLAKTEAP